MSEKKENFIVSARKYRPASWDEVVGQEAITGTLKNAIDQGHLAHAYLFCGPRGVGKTTCARIFAREINATKDDPADEDFSFNIFELDAASNNSVNDIRSLTDQVRIPPQVGRYKVYIIDEVHMLSAQAFNAFLKTLEEPPKHAIFILATTEKHKIIPTILSRCQIYDFNRIGVEEIVSHLREIANREGVKYDEESLHVIGQKADGALRDALSIFDQLASFTNRDLSYEAVRKNLHVLDYDYYFRITDALSAGDYASALLALDEILRLGFDGSHFMAGLGTHFRDLLVCRDPKTVELLEVGEAVKDLYKKQATSKESEWIIEALKITNQAEFRFRNTLNQRLLMEVTLLTLAGLSAEKKNIEHLASPALSIKEPAQPVKVISKPASQPGLAEPKAAASVQPTAEEQKEEKPVRAPEAATNEIKSVETVNERDAEPAPATSMEEKSTNARRRKPHLATVSLSGIGKPAAESAFAKANLEEPQNKYGLAGQEPMPLEKAWETVCKWSLENGKNALYGVLVRQNAGAQLDGVTLNINLLHDVEDEEFSHHRTDLLQHLRQLTGNEQLILRTTTNAVNTGAKLFSAKEKFEYLAKKNPKVIKLKDDLDLDITY